MEEGCFFLRDFLRVYVLYEYLLYFYKTTHNWSIINIFYTDFKFVLGKYFVKIIIVLAQLLFSQYFLWVLKISCGKYPHSRGENYTLLGFLSAYLLINQLNGKPRKLCVNVVNKLVLYVWFQQSSNVRYSFRLTIYIAGSKTSAKARWNKS